MIRTQLTEDGQKVSYRGTVIQYKQLVQDRKHIEKHETNEAYKNIPKGEYQKWGDIKLGKGYNIPEQFNLVEIQLERKDTVTAQHNKRILRTI